MSYLPIENYGVIGDLQTVALVGMNGSIDWFCYPSFDSPSVFAAILDDAKGGRFKIAPAREDVTCRQFYWPDTNVLVTRFLSPDGVGEVTDFMPVETERSRRRIVRRTRAVRGSVELTVECTPAFDYARAEHDVSIGENGATFRGPELSLALATSVPLRRDGGSVRAEYTLEEGESATFVLRCGELQGAPDTEADTEEQFEQTVTYWRRWLAQSSYAGRWRESVNRSALVLKLLTDEPTGAMIAAPTCGLPERIGGGRNWDYRYTWIRDAAFMVYGLIRIGFTEEAARFMRWLEARCADLDEEEPLQVMYGIDGREGLSESTLDHLEGYRGSRPVRVGNAAHDQLQLDIYGELLDAVYLYNKYGSPISYDLWSHLRGLVNWVARHWKDKDHGVWEVRSEPRHFVYSKVMCWVALDRAIRLADKRSFPSDRDAWIEVRDEIYETIMSDGWDAEQRAFVQAFGSESLDASNLIMPLVFFVSPTDTRMLGTIDAILKSPRNGGLTSNSLVHRNDGSGEAGDLGLEKGTFNMCTFWLVEALTRAGRVDPDRLNKARLIFEQMLGYANHVGLYAEQTGHSGEALGNFPQAFTHLALISAAFNLDRTLGGRE